MAKVAFTFDTKDFIRDFKNVTENIMPEIRRKALFRAGAMILRDAIVEEPKVPMSKGVTKGGRRGGGPGHLRRTQLVEKPVITKHEESVELGFFADYAAAVHEMPETTEWSTLGTGPKFLESKLLRNKDKYVEFVADEVKKRAK